MLQVFGRNQSRAGAALSRAVRGEEGEFVVATCADRPDLFEPSVELENEVWDQLSYLDFTKAHHDYYDRLLERFPEYRLCMIEAATGELVATGMCVPLRLTDDMLLPHEGWDWMVETAFEQDGKGANVIGALTISVSDHHRQRGFARDVINTVRTLAALTKCGSIIVPVRPNAKCDHPYVPMQHYIGWTDDKGRIFDPWLRSHAAVGGEIIGVCDRSMVVEQPISFWKPWTGLPLETDGHVVLPGALAPLSIDVKAGTGTYVEPNVWVKYRTPVTI
jgi:hypothetical protein